MATYDRETAKKKLIERQKQSASKAGSNFVSVLKGDLPIWRCTEGKHKIDILPYMVGKKHPELKKGDLDYIMDVWLHSNVGVDNGQYLCLQKMSGEACPICERRAELQASGEGDKEKIKKLAPKHNGLYNIICYDSEEQTNKGVQLWLINTWNMEERLQALAEEDSGEPICFADAKDGRRISFRRDGSGPTNTRYTAHAFKVRDYKISDKLLEKTYSLDELLLYPTYEEVAKADAGVKKSRDNDDDDDDRDSKSSGSKLPSEDEIEEMTRKELKVLISDLDLDIDPDDDKYEDKEDLRKAVIKAVTKSKGSKKKDDDDDDVPPSKGVSEDEIEEMTRKELRQLIKDADLDIDPDDDKYEDKEDMCNAVKKAMKKAGGGKSKKDDDDDDDDRKKKGKKSDDDDDDDRKKKGKKSDDDDIECPLKKGTFGEDFDKYAECVEECKYFDECSDAHDAMESKGGKSSKGKSGGSSSLKRRK